MLVSCHATSKSQVCLSLLDARRDRASGGTPNAWQRYLLGSYWWHMQGRARQAPQPAGRHPDTHVATSRHLEIQTTPISELRCGNLALSMQHQSRHELMYLTPSETPTKPIPGSGHCHLPSVRNLGTGTCAMTDREI